MASSSQLEGLGQIVTKLAGDYAKETSPQVKLLDSFLVFTLVAAAVQFLYCALVGTFPFNSFLSGFIATIGVFVLTVSLRLHATDKEFKGSKYVAFAEYVICSAILFLSVFNFMG